MGKNKLKKFDELTRISCVYQYPFGALGDAECPLRGRWDTEAFGGRRRPLTLELGCGKGEYTVGLAERHPDRNHIGIDIKGARIWTGACQVRDRGLDNAAYLRTSIDLLPRFFAPGEVDEIWITFPDPQMRKASKRLTGSRFLDMYRRVAVAGAAVKLKTDSPFLYAYTRALVAHNGLEMLADYPDLHSSQANAPEELRTITTFYEKQWLARGMTIKYLAFRLPAAGAPALAEPPEADDIPRDGYKSFSRDVNSRLAPAVEEA